MRHIVMHCQCSCANDYLQTAVRFHTLFTLLSSADIAGQHHSHWSVGEQGLQGLEPEALGQGVQHQKHQQHCCLYVRARSTVQIAIWVPIHCGLHLVQSFAICCLI